MIVTVEGEVKENRQPKPIPEIKLSDFDTASKEGVRILETNHLTRPEAFEGYVRATKVKVLSVTSTARHQQSSGQSHHFCNMSHVDLPEI